MDPFLDLYARVIVEHALAVAPGHTVLIESSATGAPLADAIFAHALAAHAVPRVRLWPDGFLETRVQSASPEVLEEADWVRAATYRSVDRRVNILAEENTRATSSLPAARVASAERGRHRLLKLLLDRAATGETVWCAAQYFTQAYAQEAGMSLGEYRDLLGRALLLDHDDPVAAWRHVAERQERIRAFLSGVDELRFVAPGTDLRLRVGGRRWVSSAGTANLPDGEVFTGPHEDSAEGTVRFTFPSVRNGRLVTDARLRFRGGRCVEATAASGGEFLEAALDLDDGARRLGEIAFGLNDGVDRPTGDTLIDEKIGGSFHLALGASYAETGGSNESDLHWDLVCDLRRGGEVYADGALVYRDGRFLDAVVR